MRSMHWKTCWLPVNDEFGWLPPHPEMWASLPQLQMSRVPHNAGGSLDQAPACRLRLSDAMIDCLLAGACLHACKHVRGRHLCYYATSDTPFAITPLALSGILLVALSYPTLVLP